MDWRQSAQTIKNNVRVRSLRYNPIETTLQNKNFFINKVSICKDDKFSAQVPGKIIEVHYDDSLVVSCSDGTIHVKEYNVYPPFTGVEKKIYLKPGRAFYNQ